MSCDYCEYHHDMKEGFGCDAERICIDKILRFEGAVRVGYEYCISVELPEGYAMTLPISFCPMCGERLSCGKDER